jgi:hypothetical protein
MLGRLRIRLTRHSKCGWNMLVCVCAAIVAPLTTASLAASDGPPRLDVGPSCTYAALNAVVIGRDKESCLGDERTAQNELTKNWPQFDPADRTQCVGMVTTGGPASYVELQSCLEMMRDVRALHKNDPLFEIGHYKGELNTGSPDEASLFTDDQTKVRQVTSKSRPLHRKRVKPAPSAAGYP